MFIVEYDNGAAWVFRGVFTDDAEAKAAFPEITEWRVYLGEGWRGVAGTVSDPACYIIDRVDVNKRY